MWQLLSRVPALPKKFPLSSFYCLNVECNSDRHKIQQVLYNLLDNAIKFSDQDSTITIETTPRGDKIYFRQRLWNWHSEMKSIRYGSVFTNPISPVERIKRNRTWAFDRKRTIQAHNENINVISTEGVGTEFIFSLPLTKK